MQTTAPHKEGEGSELSAHGVLYSHQLKEHLPPWPPLFPGHNMDERHGFYATHFSSCINLPNENPMVLFTGLGLDKLRKEMREFRKSLFTVPVLKSIT